MGGEKDTARPFEALTVGGLKKELQRTETNLANLRTDIIKRPALKERAAAIRAEIALRANAQVDAAVQSSAVPYATPELPPRTDVPGLSPVARDERPISSNSMISPASPRGVSNAVSTAASAVTHPPERRLVEPSRGPLRHAVDAAQSTLSRATGGRISMPATAQGPRISMTENRPQVTTPAPAAQGRGATGPWGLEAELASLDEEALDA